MTGGRDPLAVVEAAVPGRTVRNRSLASLSAYKVGGAAELFVEPQSPEEVGVVLRVAHDEQLPVFALGGGTNLLVRDGGVRGVVLRMGRAFRHVRVEGEDIVAGGIAPMAKAATAAEEASLEGLEFGFDIPGTVGGALRMNAGAHGSEIQDILKEARGYELTGAFRSVAASEIQFAYRTAVYPAELIFTEAVFGLRPGDRETLARRRKENHEYRLRNQPKGHTVGSVFVNPEGDYAGRLVEAAGFKGYRMGGAVVSEKHANWILADNDATAGEIEGLIRAIQEGVRQKFAVDLKTEIRIIGELEPAGRRRA